ncbi:tyrosine-type recombinase/integrase [Kineococcus rhizosphaerae]|uniref:Site-specific recombinase XerD n=1 Tax=Kineococcus rhizosphaerae TaxID=559628 RepID=A0A2T0RAF7_9ACTN|nr:tyrosine-type recombinase/integrase [Kineococcus rhizosphaerae]PRY18152.1 site-specific recombinase XerD [Kineococcus rhizosphaerae]
MTPPSSGVPEVVTSSTPLLAALSAYDVARLPRKESPHTTDARRRDVAALLPRLQRTDGAELLVADLTVRALRTAFADFSLDHARSSIARCWSTWNGFCSFLLAEDALAGNPMGGVQRPRPERHGPKPLRGERTAELLLTSVATRRPGARDPWPERDLAVVATLLVSGIRSAELLGLRVGDLAGAAGDHRLHVLGKGNAERSVPVEATLAEVLGNYLASRRARFARPATLPLDAPMFVDTRGRALTRDQLQYLVRQAYRTAGVHDRVARGALVHALRHTFATEVVAAGASAVEVMRLLGHQSLTTSQQYIDVAAQELRSAAAANRAYAALRDVRERADA